MGNAPSDRGLSCVETTDYHHAAPISCFAAVETSAPAISIGCQLVGSAFGDFSVSSFHTDGTPATRFQP